MPTGWRDGFRLDHRMVLLWASRMFDVARRLPGRSNQDLVAAVSRGEPKCILTRTMSNCTFFRLHHELLWFANRCLQVVRNTVAGPEELAQLPSEARYKIRDALLESADLFEEFVRDNPAGLSAVLTTWRFE